MIQTYVQFLIVNVKPAIIMSSSETFARRPAEPQAFDPLSCASLHDEIIAIPKPFAEDHNFRVAHNFFVAYGDEVCDA